MEIVALTDIHGNLRALDRFEGVLAGADVVLLTGDLTHFGGVEAAADVLRRVRRASENVLAVHGNCDRPEVADFLDEEGAGIHGVHAVVEGVAFLGLGGSLPAPGHTPSEYSEEELGELLRRAADGLDAALPWVLVSHQPPADTAVDRVRTGEHVGSRSVREFIAEREPLVCFSGHIHESDGTASIGPTGLANPGPARGGHYAYAEIEDGLNVLEIRSAG